MAKTKTTNSTTKERVAIFIDGSNFYHSVRNTTDLKNKKIDFAKLVNALKGDRLLIKTNYYNAPLDRGHNEKTYWAQQRFFSKLKQIPDFNVILCNLRKIRKSDGTFEFAVKGDDIYLATDMISLAYEDVYDSAILVSGDGDFVPAIKKVQKLGKTVENAYFSATRSDYLRKVCDNSILLDKIIPNNCLKEK